MKKLYTITGTTNSATSRSALKDERAALNKAAGTPEVEYKNENGQIIAAVPADKWAHHVTKGEDHPHVKPFFREVRLGQDFVFHHNRFRKIDKNNAKLVRDGILDLSPRMFDSEMQVHLV